eukprot:12916982-Prorocentrum_lima.AAC.1
MSSALLLDHNQLRFLSNTRTAKQYILVITVVINILTIIKHVSENSLSLSQFWPSPRNAGITAVAAYF